METTSTHKSEGSTYNDKFVPPESSQRPRTLVLCFDGTGNEIDKDHTNVSQLFSMLRKDDCMQQMVYYQTGIGTYTNRKLGPIGSVVAKTFDSMFGSEIGWHIRDGYEFLMQNYKADDRICIFGFSRGAYTARALAGMLHKVGLLPPSNIRHVEYAYKAFLKTNHQGWAMAKEFKECFSIDVDVEFVGIWDSVGSIGPGMPNPPFTNANTTIKHFRHALSLDERRARFQANVWGLHQNPTTAEGEGRIKPTGVKKREIELSTQFRKREHPTDVEEVWFSGCHSDVGGGSVHHSTRHSLARISLRWMIRQCFLTNTGIMFNSKSLREKLGMDPSTLYPSVIPRPPPLPIEDLTIKRVPRLLTYEAKCDKATWPGVPEAAESFEEQEELYDALTPSYDQLELKRAWWVLEIIPATRRALVNNQVVKKLSPNFGRPRVIAAQKHHGVKLHRSVRTRMQAHYEAARGSDGKKAGQIYKPKPILDVEPTWVA